MGLINDPHSASDIDWEVNKENPVFFGVREEIENPTLTAEEYDEVLKYFSYKHLKEEYQPFSKRFHDVAIAFLADYCNGKVKSANQFTHGIQRLIEAKDALIRSLI